PRVLGVLDDAHDLDLVEVVRIETEAFADRVFACEETAREGLVDDDDARRMRVILRREAAPGEERNLHRRQKVFAHLMDVCLALRFYSIVGRGRRARQKYTAVALAPCQQCLAREGDSAHAGHSLDAL